MSYFPRHREVLLNLTDVTKEICSITVAITATQRLHVLYNMEKLVLLDIK